MKCFDRDAFRRYLIDFEDLLLWQTVTLSLSLSQGGFITCFGRKLVQRYLETAFLMDV